MTLLPPCSKLHRGSALPSGQKQSSSAQPGARVLPKVSARPLPGLANSASAAQSSVGPSNPLTLQAAAQTAFPGEGVPPRLTGYSSLDFSTDELIIKFKNNTNNCSYLYGAFSVRGIGHKLI